MIADNDECTALLHLGAHSTVFFQHFISPGLAIYRSRATTMAGPRARQLSWQVATQPG